MAETQAIEKGHRFTLTVTMYILTLWLPIPIPLKYPTRVWFLGGGSFTPEKLGAEKLRGQSVDITAKGPDFIRVVWAFSCLKSWCRERDSNPHTRKGSGF